MKAKCYPSRDGFKYLPPIYDAACLRGAISRGGSTPRQIGARCLADKPRPTTFMLQREPSKVLEKVRRYLVMK